MQPTTVLDLNSDHTCGKHDLPSSVSALVNDPIYREGQLLSLFGEEGEL